MRILHIIPSLAKGGAERLVLDICISLQEIPNVVVSLVTFHENNSYTFLSSKINHKVIPSWVIPSLKGKMKKNVCELQQFIEEFQPDIIHSHLFESEMVLSQIDYKKASYFVHFHDNMKQFEGLKVLQGISKQRLTNYFEKKIVLKAYSKRKTFVVNISKDTFEYSKKVLPKGFNTCLMHNAINTSSFSCSRDLNVIFDRITIIGSLVDKKGQNLAIQVISELHNRGIYLYLDILGEGKNRSKLQQMINKLKLTEFITLHGNVDYPLEFLQNSFVYLHTAKYEPFGLVMIEAMAAELPIVCTDAMGNRDLIKDGYNGFILLERSPLLIADKIEILYKDKNLWFEMSKKAKAFSNKFDISEYTRKLLDLYQLNR